MFDPFAGAGKDANGTLIYTVEDSELANFDLDDEERLRAHFEAVKVRGEAWELSEENVSELDNALV
jgi:hypothetical protein